jgi:hypothetical protein
MQRMGQFSGGAFFSPPPGAQATSPSFERFGQGFPNGTYLQRPGQMPMMQMVPVVTGVIMYSARRNNQENRRNPNWPFQGPRHGQMWLLY